MADTSHQARGTAPRLGGPDQLRQVHAEILGRAPEHDLAPSLERMRAVTDLLGHPERAFRAVHLTGTNGKTSTTRMVERLVREHGLRTGRFTSPHLVDPRERIAVDGVPLDPERFVETYLDVLTYVDMVDAASAAATPPGVRMTYFELFVTLAYAAFADAPVDVAVVEVGMGGSWDATNVVDGQVAVITPVALDHQRFLGRDLTSIAREKAGVIKPGAHVVTAVQPYEVMDVLVGRCHEVGATLLREGVDFGVAARDVAVGGQVVSFQGLGGVYPEVFVPLHGPHQAHNAALALAAVEALLGAGGGRDGIDALDAATVQAGFADVTSPGRLEVVRRSPTVLVDAAHNPAGAEVLARALKDAFGFDRLVGVVGVMADKDVEGVLVELEPVLDEIVVTGGFSPRAMDPDELAEIARDVFDEDRVHVAAHLDEAVDLAAGRAESGDGPLGGNGVVVTGSIPLVGQARALFGRDGEAQA